MSGELNGYAPSYVPKKGDRVELVVPENPALHGQTGVVAEVTSWGAFVRTQAAATGRFRAHFSEMRPARPLLMPDMRVARDQGYCGEICEACGGSRMRRNGACLVCDDCGGTSGCS